jgi:hypothetical protein
MNPSSSYACFKEIHCFYAAKLKFVFILYVLKLSRLRMGTEPIPETLYSNELTRLCAREDYIESYLFCLFLNLCSIY